MSPAEVEHVVSKPQEYHTAHGQQSTQELGKLEREGGPGVVGKRKQRQDK